MQKGVFMFGERDAEGCVHVHCMALARTQFIIAWLVPTDLVSWVAGDAEKLPFADNMFDAYTIAFGVCWYCYGRQIMVLGFQLLNGSGFSDSPCLDGLRRNIDAPHRVSYRHSERDTHRAGGARGASRAQAGGQVHVPGVQQSQQSSG